MMLRNLLIFVLAAAASWYVIDTLLQQKHITPPPVPEPQGETSTLEPIVPAPAPGQPYRLLADINVHTVDELQLLFDRVEQLLDRPRSEGEEPLITIVLHGPEVQFFALDNYARYKSIVDQAARLSALGGVELSICQTRMRQYGLGEKDVPAFLKQVPYGPDEVKRLLEDGFVYM